jgi:hypothetical protein
MIKLKKYKLKKREEKKKANLEKFSKPGLIF